ncbi:MAG: hypothetical protein COB01_02095 [Lutibacter sp.]|nr:MAG: hypothetical protein COB01_02095 [Lutibacter sp.]
MKMKKVLFILLLLFVQIMNAQCAMCKAVVESSNAPEAEGLNSGILYLMVFPYLLVGVLFYFIFKSKRKNKTLTFL